MLLQAKEHQTKMVSKPQEAKGSREQVLTTSEETSRADILTLDFASPEPGENNFCCSGHSVCATLLQSSLSRLIQGGKHVERGVEMLERVMEKQSQEKSVPSSKN